MSFTLANLSCAYRKAKVDLYYSTNPYLFAIADYEMKLAEHLPALLDKLNGADTDWAIKPEFLGDWTLTPKTIMPASNSSNDTGIIFASPEDDWNSQSDAKKKPSAEFRLMARCSMDFHVLSALWMMEVGNEFDQKLSRNVYGARLRRKKDGEINKLALGSFKPYLKPFRDWRDGGIKAMRGALADNKKILGLTADVTSFYHELNSSFMLDKSFLTEIGVELNEHQTKLHELFINAVGAWAKNTPLEKGLPVGLPASAVIANSALFKLDKFIEQQVVPLYYGRYVDDILLVMENNNGIATTERFWEWIFKRDGGDKLLHSEKNTILFRPDYLKGSRIAFEGDKNKLFVLSGEPGSALVNAISEQINQRASEWRALPDLPDSAETIATDLLKATNHKGEQADNLRKTDALTLHRAGFAIKLRDYEAYERDLPPDSWQQHRHAFFSAVTTHLLTPVKFFELAQYLPRVIRMATACEDFEYLSNIIEAINTLIAKIDQECEHQIKALPVSNNADFNYNTWHRPLYGAVAESIISAFPPNLRKKGNVTWNAHMAIHWPNLINGIWRKDSFSNWMIISPQDIKENQALLFSCDLAHIPLRFFSLPKEMVSQRGIPTGKALTIAEKSDLLPLCDGSEAGVEILTKWLKFKGKAPTGLAYATRPFSLNELYVIDPKPFSRSDHDSLNKVIQALRGFELTEHKMPRWDKKQQVLHIPDGQFKAKHTVAVSSWETKETSFIAAAMKQDDPSIRQRYSRLNRLINELISRPDNAGYLILPELALPPRWFMRVAQKLKGRGISFIAGVEYLHAPKKRVHNQVWASLTHDGLGFPSLMLYRQDKQRPALHEEQELFRLAGLEMRPAQNQAWKIPPIIKHGDFRFALMICSELTSIRYRAELRGKVDALFVPEWNSDTDTFNALVESAALDIHAYIIQCNNRLYGDSRIRAPYKDRWKRDLLKVKGGNHDYCITGEIDILALRQFQSSHRSPAAGFKPVPDGFSEDMAKDRKVLPKGEQ